MARQLTDMAENKLSILYYISCLDIPLTNSQITEFFLEKDLMNYFDLQQYLSELVNSEHLNYLEARNIHFYSITPRGLETLAFFKERISKPLRESIEEYAQANQNRFKKESQLTSDYKKIGNQNYEVVCRVMEGEIVLLELRLNVVNVRQAKTICNNWKAKAPEIYKSIMTKLIEN